MGVALVVIVSVVIVLVMPSLRHNGNSLQNILRIEYTSTQNVSVHTQVFANITGLHNVVPVWRVTMQATRTRECT